ncbi:hypothetical protein DFH07DRAFT_772438 [Mycena maculata]|uniref:Chromo domain-containing protein n=1 Tax=Mycena maculata TaxID=230809 RepID=A0AAD7J928_9AGAR|nr:hypothetical protein DFH07DRAFT_772438 [Mycena maculata]
MSSPSTPPRAATPDQIGAVQALYRLALPSPLKGASSRKALAEENARLRYIAELAGIELEKNYVQMQLMNRENTRLRTQIIAKKSKQKRSYMTNQARLLAGSEMVAALLHDDHVKSMTAMMKEMGPQFRAIKKLLTKNKAVVSGPANYGNSAGTEPEPVRGRGRGQGQGRGGGCGRGRGGRGRGQASDAADGSDDESEAAPARGRRGDTRGHGRGRGRMRGGGAGRGGGHSESEDEEQDIQEQPESPDESSSDSSDDESTRSGHGSPEAALGVVDDAELQEPDGDEVEIATFNGHRWVKGNVEFQVVWTDKDVTWESLANVNDCAAMDVYLAHHSVADPILLGKRKFVIRSPFWPLLDLPVGNIHQTINIPPNDVMCAELLRQHGTA